MLICLLSVLKTVALLICCGSHDTFCQDFNFVIFFYLHVQSVVIYFKCWSKRYSCWIKVLIS